MAFLDAVLQAARNLGSEGLSGVTCGTIGKVSGQPPNEFASLAAGVAMGKPRKLLMAFFAERFLRCCGLPRMAPSNPYSVGHIIYPMLPSEASFSSRIPQR
jgi:hypothetical protein